MEVVHAHETGQMADKRKRKERKPPSKWQRSMLPLKEAGFVGYQAKNNGLHIIFFGGTDKRIDFWPTTGHWRRLVDGVSGDGYQSLLVLLKATHAAA